MNKTADKTSIRFLAEIALFTAVTCILAPMSLKIGIVPVTLTNLVIYFSLYILGMKRGSISYCTYLLIGLIGIPVFSNFSAGPATLFGPTGGYLIGFIPMTLIAGFFIEKFERKFIFGMIGMVLGTAVCYLFGTVWLAYQAGYTMKQALEIGVLPFIVVDLVKMVIAAVVAPQVYKRMVKAGII